MRARRHTHSEGDEHGIDLAPMLDFVLNLLIFFIITTSFVREAGITVLPPRRQDRRARREREHPDRDPLERTRSGWTAARSTCAR